MPAAPLTGKFVISGDLIVQLSLPQGAPVWCGTRRPLPQHSQRSEEPRSAPPPTTMTTSPPATRLHPPLPRSLLARATVRSCGAHRPNRRAPCHPNHRGMPQHSSKSATSTLPSTTMRAPPCHFVWQNARSSLKLSPPPCPV
jgi:hypothetical protein